MARLKEFLNEVLQADGEPVYSSLSAYHMDGTSPGDNVRKRAGLGACNCCDYFTFSNGVVALIEETRLGWQIRDIRKKLAYLEEGKRNERLLEILRHENLLKVYGSLLVLCRLARKLTDKAEASAMSRTAEFWLAFSGDMDQDDVRAVDQIRDDLIPRLRSLLTPAVVKDVRIVPANELDKRLPSRPSPL